jgi:hypothetical protein
MRTPLQLRAAWAIAIFALSTTTSTLPAASTNEPAAPESFVVQPPFVAPAVPQSAFVIPKKQAEGRDPFYPKSTRPYVGDLATTKPVVTAPVAELLLRGISGTDENPLAIINTTTFGVGDELDVTTKAGKMRIRCIEINKAVGTVSVQVGGERQQLRLTPQK